MKRILGISAFYHDSAAVLLQNGEILAASQEERFTRIKHTSDFPVNAIKFCLESSGYRLNDLDAIVFYDKPLLKLERLLETYYAFAPKGLFSFLKAMPIWAKEKIFLRRTIKDNLEAIEAYDKKKLIILFSEHHFSHAASAFYSSSFQESAILTIDGVGEWTTASICYGKSSGITMLKEMRFPHSIGLLYSSFTYFLGFKVNSGEYKLMGLAPYGDINSLETGKFITLIKEKLVQIRDDGSVWLNQEYFNYSTGLTMIKEKPWEKLFGFKVFQPSDEYKQHHCNLALACQIVTEEIILKMAHETKRLTGSRNLCMAGGVALNCVANGKLVKEKLFDKIFIQPASGDAGGALGAAQIANYQYFLQKRTFKDNKDSMQGAFLGPEFSNTEAIRYFRKINAQYKQFEDTEELCSTVSDLLIHGNIIGWFQGKMEFGPRSLGNRSILADARNAEMQKKLNLKIKKRESFRPFAPSMLFEDQIKYFDIQEESPYMLINATLKEEWKKQLPKNYESLSLLDKLYISRSDIPAITHIDFSARIQTVDQNTNPRFWQLLTNFKSKTGIGLLLNTSFNVRGEPIVCTPEDAFECFMRTEMDWLVINDFLFKKEDQVSWDDKLKLAKKFELD